MKNKLLVIVDMQNDFVAGSLGSAEAQAIVDNVCEKIRGWEGVIAFTYDTHGEDYMNTLEGKKLPVPHCIRGTSGWALNDKVRRFAEGELLPEKVRIRIEKPTFGSFELVEFAKSMNFESIEIVGLCTDICVISNAILLRAGMPDTPIAVDAKCCAGVTPQTHAHALSVMKKCQIDVINEE